MRLALDLAQKGSGRVNPNPLVGCVIVKNGAIIGRGWHDRYGGPHAERAALDDCAVSPDGATAYVTLEPCCHHGKQPPCTEALIASGIRRVVSACRDANPLVAGQGVAQLRAHGIEVTEGVLERESLRLNAPFFYYIRKKSPFVVMKYAMTMDGKIATASGDAHWITGEAARLRVHADRNRYAAIMVGVGTVLADDPLLTCRIEGGRNPVRVICDTHLRTPVTSNIVSTAHFVPTIFATTCIDDNLHRLYTDKSCRIITLPVADGHVDLRALMSALGAEGIDSVLLEGGSTLNWSALTSGIVNRVQTYVAPKLVGGRAAPSPVGGAGVEKLSGAFTLADSEITLLGNDVLIESEVIYNVHGDN